MKKGLSGLALLLIALAIVAYWPHDPMPQRALQEASADPFMDGPYGRYRYRTAGDDSGPAVILIHSFNGFLESWRDSVPALEEAGYRVVAYDLYGRGLSDLPDSEMTIDLFVDQLDQLCDALGIASAHLVGGSFGAVIAAEFALRYPHRVSSLQLVGPAGWRSDAGGARRLVIDTPLIGELLFHYFGDALIEPSVDAYFATGRAMPWAKDQWSTYAQSAVFQRASLDILRHSPVTDYETGWRQLGGLKLPITFYWGDLDVSFPVEHVEKVRSWIVDAHIVRFPQAAHWLNIEQPERFNRELLEHLSRRQ